MPTQLPISENKPYLALPPSWDSGWRQAKIAAARQGGTATALLLGDSVLQGKGASDGMRTSAAELLYASLKSRLGLYADYWPSQAYSDQGGLQGGDMPWTLRSGALYAGYWWNIGLHGVGGNPTANVGAYFQQFVSPYACTAIDIIYADVGAGTWAYTVDGGGQQSVTNTSDGTSANSQIKRISLTGLANTVHTIQYGWQSAGDSVVVLGIVTYPGAASGLGFARMALDGHAGGRLIAGTQGGGNGGPANDYPLNRPECIQGKLPMRDSSNNTGFGFPFQPDLLIMELAVNDCSVGTSLANYFTTIDRLIQSARRGKTDCSILFMAPWYGNGTGSDINVSAYNNPGLYTQYLGCLYQLSQIYDCGIASFHAKWQSNPYSAGLLSSSTNITPSDAGHADIANTLASIL